MVFGYSSIRIYYVQCTGWVHLQIVASKQLIVDAITCFASSVSDHINMNPHPSGVLIHLAMDNAKTIINVLKAVQFRDVGFLMHFHRLE